MHYILSPRPCKLLHTVTCTPLFLAVHEHHSFQIEVESCQQQQILKDELHKEACISKSSFITGDK